MEEKTMQVPAPAFAVGERCYVVEDRVFEPWNDGESESRRLWVPAVVLRRSYGETHGWEFEVQVEQGFRKKGTGYSTGGRIVDEGFKYGLSKERMRTVAEHVAAMRAEADRIEKRLAEQAAVGVPTAAPEGGA